MQSNVYRSAATVTIFSTVAKAFSFLYRIILSHGIGAEGMGIYQICISVFGVFLTAASSGIPVTVSRLIAKHNSQNHRDKSHSAVTAGCLCTMLITIPITIIFLLFGDKMTFLFSDGRCLPVFIILLPGLIIDSLYAVFRGAFWGNQQFLPYSIIELVEDIVNVLVGAVLIVAAPDGISGAKMATVAVLCSFIFSFVVSLICYRVLGGRFANPKGQFKTLIKSSLPITIMRTSTSLLNSIVAVIMPYLLMRFCSLSSSEAISQYGVVMGMSVPMLFIPSSFIGSIAVVVAPKMSENFYSGKRQSLSRDISRTLKTCSVIACLIIPLLFGCGRTIGQFIYANQWSGEVISLFSFMLLPMCISMISTTMLNSINMEFKTLIYYLVGAICMIISILTLTKYVGILSYLIGMSASFLVTAIFNVRLLKKQCAAFDALTGVVKIAGLCILCCAFSYFLANALEHVTTLFFQLAINGVLTTIFSLALYVCTGYVDLKAMLNSLKKK